MDTSTVVLLISVAAAVPTTLVAWLHFRQNALDARILAQDKAREQDKSNIYRHLSEHFIQRGEVEAKLETLRVSVDALRDMVSYVADLMRQKQTKG